MKMKLFQLVNLDKGVMVLIIVFFPNSPSFCDLLTCVCVFARSVGHPSPISELGVCASD